jgi:hypothetical protein
MYRPARFVKNVRVLTFKDVNVEELDKPDLRLPEGNQFERAPDDRSGVVPIALGHPQILRTPPGGAGPPSWGHGSEGRPRPTG